MLEHMANMNLLTELSNQMADAVDRAAESVVQVRSRRWRPAAGLVFADEHVLVSDHAVEHEEDLAVRVDGRAVPATLAGRDPATDLAVLKVAGLGLRPVTTSGAPARVGQLAVAVGRSWSGGVVAALGVISSIGGPWRTGRGPAVEQVIRTDITPYPGFTGGALLAPDGSVVGITSGILLRGLSLVIPAAIAWPVADMLARHGRIRRAFLGLGGQPIRLPESQRAGGHGRGILIVSVSDDSPARRNGLLVGDVLLAFNGHGVEDPETLLSLLTGDLIDRPVPVEILRAGAVQTVTITLAERTPHPAK
jgi:S1-C subfamily serine protease